MIFLGTPQLRGGVNIFFFYKVSFEKHPNAHVLWVTFGDLSSIGIVWSPLVLLVTHVCARFESYFQNAILGSTDPFVFKVIRICGSV